MQRGQVVADRFVIERRAGTGGMADVHRAFDRHTGALVALKTLHQAKQTEEHVGRFLREAAVLAELYHPGIVRYVAHGTVDGRGWLAMEWVEGVSLGTRLSEQGRLAIDEAVALAAKVADALGAAHRRGVVHRDVKPSNLMLEGGDARRIKILDFGVARLRGVGRDLSRSGMIIGTAGYMAPEQAHGDPDVDARADVFSLGCVLFRCLTGQSPFSGDDQLAVLLKLVLDEPPRVRELRPEVPRELDELVARMLARDPDARPADGAAAAAELLAWSGGAAPESAAGSPERASTPSLTGIERRVTCMVLARAPVSGDGAIDPPAPEVAERLRAAVAPLQGHLDTLADGSLVVTMVSSGAATDQAARAARTALAMRPLVPAFPIALLAGRSLDPAVFTPRPRGALMGEVIDRGVSLLKRARASEIRVDDVAAGLLDRGFDVAGDELGLYLRGERDAGEPAGRLLGKPTPFVGRDRELRMLEALFEEAAGEPAARVALVTAEAGVGKSRLLHELLRRIEGRKPSVDDGGSPRTRGSAPIPPPSVWIGHGGAAFGLLGAAIRRAAGVAHGEPLDVRRRKLRARAGRHLAGGDIDRVAVFLGEIAGIPFDEGGPLLAAARADPVLMGDQVLRAFEDFLAAECAAQPVILVLEDLHLGDAPSVRLLDAALRSLSASPLLVLALARPDVHAIFPDLYAARAPAEIKLGNLPPRWSERLVRQTLGEAVAHATVTRICELAGGNAFYLEELIRAVAEGRGEALPETVLAMVQALLEDLDPEERRILRAASVFGHTFQAEGVRALVGTTRADLDGWLRALVDREVILRRGLDEAPSGGGEYSFRHAHVRVAAYATLTEADRELGHRLAAIFLEQPDGAAEPLGLAEHFERGGEPERAAPHYRRAAEQALVANDLDGALGRAERGVAAGASGEALGGLHLVQAEALRWLGRSAEARERAIEAQRVLPRASAGWSAAVGEIARAALKLGDQESPERLSAELDEALDVALPEDLGALVLAGTHLTTTLFLLGRRTLAERLLARLEALAGGASSPAVRARLLETRAFQAVSAGDDSAFIDLATAAAAAFTEIGDLRSAAVQRCNVGGVLNLVGAYAEAERELSSVLVVAERMRLLHVVAAARLNLGLSLARTGRVSRARALAEQSLAEAEAQRDLRLVVGARIQLARVAEAGGELDTAEREARAAAELASGPVPQRAYALGVASLAALAQGRVEAAVEAARAAEAVLAAIGGMDEGEATTRLAIAEARRAAVDLDGARRAIEEARARLLQRADRIGVERWRESFLDRVPEHRRTLALAAELLGGAT